MFDIYSSLAYITPDELEANFSIFFIGALQRRHKGGWRPFWRTSRIPNAFTRRLGMNFPMSLKTNTSCFSVEVVWISGRHPTTDKLSKELSLCLFRSNGD